DEVTALAREAIAEAGATSKQQMGAVMKVATAKAAGRVDGKTLSQAVQKLLP
ncbi:MAG: GatB/YqeY domain-containing protein, partial [Terrimicrobium sp.]